MSTPRTDAILEWARPMGDDAGPPHEQYVSADFARQLETELAQLNAFSAARESGHQLELAAANARIAELEKDKARVDHLAMYWDSQGDGHTMMGRYFANPTGSFRHAIDAAIKATP